MLAHQSILEFVAAVTRPRSDLSGEPLMPLEQARLEAEDMITQLHGRHYGAVRVVDPFLDAAPNGVHELPALYDV